MFKSIYKQTNGFSVVEAIIAVLLVVTIAGAGFYVYNKNNSTDTKQAQNSVKTQTDSVDVPEAPSISAAADLNTAQQALDQTNLDASDSDLAELNDNLADL